MSFDLLDYIELGQHPQPDELTAALKRLFMALRQVSDAPDWAAPVETYMAEARRLIGHGTVTGWNAAGALFVGHALTSALAVKGRPGGLIILGFVLQLSMTEAQWQGYLHAMKADKGPATGADSDVLRVGDFPRVILEYLFKRSERDILRSLYQGTRQAIDSAAQQAMKDATDFADWQARLGVLAAYLTLRRWMPLRVNAPQAEGQDASARIELQQDEAGRTAGGQFVPPPQDDHPILAWLFDATEIEALHRREAYAAECFAHLFTAHFGGMITEAHQQEVAAEYARRAAQSKLDARQWLALGKSRFESAPYL